jgi:hypothetical protein
MRKHIALPLTLLAVLGLLSVGAALLAVAQSPTLLYFSVPANDPGAAAQLDAIVRHTIDAPSFTYRIPGSNTSISETLVYQAPNRMHDEIGSQPLETVAIGSTFYFHRYDAFGSGGQGWVKFVHPPLGYTSARQYAMTLLQRALVGDSVTRRGGVFRVTTVNSNDPFAQGQYETTITIHVHDAYVRSMIEQLHGSFRLGNAYIAVNSRSSVIFSHIGSSPSVTAPKATPVDHGDPLCGPRSYGVGWCAF